jgi:hypothetical protein
MWKTIFYWSLLSFGIVHFASGVVAFLNLRHAGPLKFTWLIPLVVTFLGGLIPCTAGVITGLTATPMLVSYSSATMIAGVYTTAEISMSTTEVCRCHHTAKPTLQAFVYGVGQCVIYVLSGLSRNTVSM